LSRLIAASCLIVIVGSVRADELQFDEKVIGEQVRLMAEQVRKHKNATDEAISKDMSAIREIVRSPRFRAFITTEGSAPRVESDQQLGKLVARAWAEYRCHKGDDFKEVVTFADIAGVIGTLVGVRFESEPPKAVISIDGKEKGAAPVLEYLSTGTVYRIEAKVAGYTDFSDPKYTPPAKGELKKIKLDKK
jgi:hypothetical protein